MFVRNFFLAAAMASLSLTAPTRADEARVIEVRALPNGDGSYDFDVTLSHPDTGWEHYVDRWDVIGPDGKLLGKRVLYHPHVNEQPFTRSQRVRIPAGVAQVSIRTHCKRDGDGKAQFKVELPK